jgi:hypothetical protein
MKKLNTGQLSKQIKIVFENDIEVHGVLLSNHLPNYRCLITNYLTATKRK